MPRDRRIGFAFNRGEEGPCLMNKFKIQRDKFNGTGKLTLDKFKGTGKLPFAATTPTSRSGSMIFPDKIPNPVIDV